MHRLTTARINYGKRDLLPPGLGNLVAEREIADVRRRLQLHGRDNDPRQERRIKLVDAKVAELPERGKRTRRRP